MKVTQVQQELFPSTPTLKDVRVGEWFQPAGYESVYMRVAPVKTLVHSTMVHEVLTRGDCFVIALSTGMLTVMKYNTLVHPVKANLQYSI